MIESIVSSMWSLGIVHMFSQHSSSLLLHCWPINTNWLKRTRRRMISHLSNFIIKETIWPNI